MVENALHFIAHENRVHHITQRAKGQGIVHFILHESAAIPRLEAVEMMPKAVGAAALFIDELLHRHHCFDLSHPALPRQRRHPDSVGDDLALKHWLWLSRGDSESQLGRGDGVEILRVGKK